MSAKRKTNTKPKIDHTGYEYRSFDSVRAKSFDNESRTVDATISTESPVDMPDYDRWEMVPEMLLASGMRMSASKQVPLLDSHSRFQMSNQLGSVRAVEVEDGGKIRGTLHFSEVHNDEFTKVREGHATDVSVGYRVIRKKYIEAGKTKRIAGREFTGPLNVVTEWRLLEVSLTPIGADEQAKLRGFDLSAFSDLKESFKMNEALRKLLIEAGMPAEHDDEEAQRWLVENPSALAGKPEERSEEKERKTPPVIGSDGVATGGEALTPESVRKLIADTFSQAEKEREERQERHRSDVDGILEVSGIAFSDSDKQRFYSMNDIASVRKAVIDHRAESQQQLRHSGPAISFGPAQRDKHREAVGSALMLRAVQTCLPTADSDKLESAFPAEKRSKHMDEFRNASLYDMAVECLQMDGVDIRGRSREHIAMAALGFGDQIGIRTEGGYHNTGSFAIITQDAVNKSMMLGYGEYPTTWRGPMRQGVSVKDFKTIHRMQLGAVPNLPIWNDSEDPAQASFKDEEETYGVECRSLALSFGYKLLVNDDMSEITRSPFKLGDAAARTVNTVAWSPITGNQTMRDGVKLFSAATGARKRPNLTTGAGAPSATTIQTLTDKMMQMRGSNTPEGNESDDILGLMPRYLVLPSALRTTGLQVVRSIADPNGTHAGVVNVNNDLIPVVEPLLDANSTTAWYLFAEPTRVETVEVTFLQGQESPQTRMYLDQKKLSQETIILQTFGVKALDHRGVQKHAGA